MFTDLTGVRISVWVCRNLCWYITPELRFIPIRKKALCFPFLPKKKKTKNDFKFLKSKGMWVTTEMLWWVFIHHSQGMMLNLKTWGSADKRESWAISNTLCKPLNRANFHFLALTTDGPGTPWLFYIEAVKVKDRQRRDNTQHIMLSRAPKKVGIVLSPCVTHTPLMRQSFSSLLYRGETEAATAQILCTGSRRWLVSFFAWRKMTVGFAKQNWLRKLPI